MGLLDDLLAGLTDRGSGGQPMGQPTGQPQAQAGGGMSKVMIALLPVVLSMLANQRGGTQTGSGQRAGASAGGLGDVLGSLLGGGGGAGGLGGLLTQLQRAGFGQQAQSWVSSGQNQPIPPDAMGQVFGQGGLEEIARRAGVSQEDASRGLAQLLPEVVDHVTPQGRAPEFDALSASVDALTRRYGLS